MGQLADALGIGILFNRNGKEYQCSRIKTYHRGMLEAWLEKEAWEGVERSKAWVSTDTFRTSCRELTLAIGAQELSQSSEKYDKASRSAAGVRYLLTLLLRECGTQKGFEHQGGIDEEWVEKWMNEDAESAIRIYNQAIAPLPKPDEKNDGERPS